MLYLVVDITEFELPIAVFDTIVECAKWLSVPYKTCQKSISRSTVLRCFCRVYKISLEE